MPNLLHDAARTLSVKPGVYLFKDTHGRVLYVGKAKSLRKRVLQYFDRKRLDPAKKEMVNRARAIETILTTTEVEALALEATFIQRYQPPYNVRLADDSSYLYVKITNDVYPQVSLTRRVLPDGAWYRGPYPNVRAIRQTLKEARKLFPWCAYPNPDAGRGKACFAYHLGLCPGICIRAISLEEYQRSMERLKRFLDGDTGGALRTLRERMQALSDEQRYEQAARVRDAMGAIERATTPQNVVTPRSESLDVIGLTRHGTHAAVAVLQVRHGRVTGTPLFPLLHPPDEPTVDVLRGFFLQYYRSAGSAVTLILLPVLPDDTDSLASWLSQHAGQRVRVERAQRGWKRTLLELAETNADAALRKSLTELTSPANLAAALRDLATALHLPQEPTRIETYDISNIQGTLATGSMVVFVDGVPKRSAYRKFKIHIAGAPNDTAMMKEMLERRFRRHGRIIRNDAITRPASESRAYLPDRQVSRAPDSRAPLAGGGSIGGGTEAVPTRTEWPLPDLVILDGGKGQLGVGVSVLNDLALSIPIAALAKREEELFVPGHGQPLRLPRTSPALYLLQRMRDEAHRFTIGYHRVLRKKRMTRSILEDIPGVGPATRKKLLRAFGSVAGIRDASREELDRVLGSPRHGERVYAFLHTA